MLLAHSTERIRAAAERLGLPWPDGVQVRRTDDPAHGHVATNYALAVAKPLGKNPRDIATQIAEALHADPQFSSVTVAGPGFVNITYAASALTELLGSLDRGALGAPIASRAKGERILVELGAENIAKPMGVGHMRSNIIGMALVRLWEALGAETVTVNHLGDWGTQFGKLVVAFRKWGTDADVESAGINALVQLYQRFTAEAKEHPELDDEGREAFRLLEAGDPEVQALWQRFVDLSLRDYAVMYARLNVRHQHFLGESFYKDKLDAVFEELRAKGVTTENADGSVAIEFTEEGLPSTLVRKSNGSTLYLTRDLAALQYRTERFHPTRTLYLVADQQSLHFQQVFAAAKRLGWNTPAEHISFGMVLGESGKKMSTREGTAIRLDELLGRAEEVALNILRTRGSDAPVEQQQQLARDLATAAVMYNDLSQNRSTAIVFDWEQMLAFDGDTAPYLLYAVARGNALEEKAKEAGVVPGVVRPEDPRELALALELLTLHDRVVTAAESSRPNFVAEQLFKIARAYSAWYADVPILTAETDAQKSERLALALLTRDLLRWGMDLLGLPRVAKM